MSRLEVWTSVFKLTPREGESIFKVSLVFYFICHKRKQWIHIWYTVCLLLFNC